MAAAARVAKLHETEAAEPLAELGRERSVLEAERARLAQVDGKRAEAEAALAGLDAEAASIDQTERDARAIWISSPSEIPPASLTKRREALARKRLSVAGELANAKRTP